jgi:2-polyprenyl-3-methyl-5-hydroxy-6-metoxy-1,4-benzoquinol methylase
VANPSRVRRLRPSIAAVPNFDAPEVFAHEAIDKIARALPPLERVYSRIRFSILRPKLLSVMDLLLPDEGRILDVGCGFGLFAAYFGQTQSRREIIGIDPNARRIAMAERVARSLSLKRHHFIAGDVRDANLQGPFNAVYMLDVMHHIPADAQRGVLERIYDMLVPGGVLLMKDITTEPHYQLVFTEMLDRLMVGRDEPLAYRHHRAWGELLTEIGFRTRIVRVPDVLPYPHVVISATKS